MMKTQTLASRIEALVARAMLAMPAPLLRLYAGWPVVREGQTLDVQTQLLLRMQNLRGGAALGGRSVARERAFMETQCRVLEPKTDRAVAAREIQLAGAAGPIAGRIYRPEGCPENSGALVFYHGGGFVLGSLDSHDGVCRALAARANCVVIAVDYRLAPENPAPAGLEDAISAFRDIAARSDEFAIDPSRLAVGGDSAGGNLSAVVSQTTRDDARSPCFQLLFYPAVDFARDRESVRTFATGFLLEKASMDWFRGHYIPPEIDNSDPRLSPIYGDLEGLAPALVMTGGFDPLRDEGEAYGQAMRAAGVSVEIERKPSMIHAFLNFAGGVAGADAALSQGARALAKVLARAA